MTSFILLLAQNIEFVRTMPSEQKVTTPKNVPSNLFSVILQSKPMAGSNAEAQGFMDKGR